MKSILKVAAFGLAWMLFVSASSIQSCHAAEAEQEAASLWINAGGMSYHFDRSKQFNERNTGVGVELRLRDDVSLMTGRHINSMATMTHYVAANYQPFSVGPFKVGASVGFMDGYRLKNNGRAFFAAIPMLTYEGKHLGFNAGVIPDIPSQHVDGAVVLQIKVRAF